MPVTRKRQQQQRAQQQQLQQQQQQQQQQSEHHDKQNNNNIDATNGSSPSHQNQQSQQPSSKTPLTRAKAIKDNTRSSGDQNEKSAVHKDIQAILESDLYCAICREIYIDPLILNCAHSFCKFCLNHWLSKQVGCPSCRMVVVFQTENLALKDIVNKMIKTSSPEFQLERAQSLDQRSKAEQLQKVRGVKPIMEKKSFNLHGKARKISNKRDFIRSWRGPNGATIWQTKLDPVGQVVRPEMADDVSSTDYDDDDDYDEDFDHEDESNSEAGNLDVGLLGDLPTDDPDEDESAASTIDIDSSDESYLSDRRLQNHHLNILAGFEPADSDEDFEVEASSNGHSDADSSMVGIMDDDSDESGREYIYVRRVHGFVPRGVNRPESSTEEEDEEEEAPAAEDDENREAAFSSDTDYTSDSSNTSGSSEISYASEQSGEFDDDEDDDSNYVF